jgi:hypothetical protein
MGLGMESKNKSMESQIDALAKKMTEQHFFEKVRECPHYNHVDCLQAAYRIGFSAAKPILRALYRAELFEEVAKSLDESADFFAQNPENGIALLLRDKAQPLKINAMSERALLEKLLAEEEGAWFGKIK